MQYQITHYPNKSTNEVRVKNQRNAATQSENHNETALDIISIHCKVSNPVLLIPNTTSGNT